MAEAIVSAALEKARGLANEEAKFLYGVKDQVKEIETQLKFMKAFLKEADLKQDEDERIRTWVVEIRELAYEVEDVLETFAFEIQSRRRGGIKNMLKRFVCIFCECFILHKVGSEIKGIKKKLTELKANLETFGVKNIGEGRSPDLHHGEEQWLRKKYPHMGIEEDFVGMEKDIKQLVSLMANKDPGCRVVSIWGMGGRGKTTLAAKIYDHTDVRPRFDSFAWVCITQQCQTKNVLQSILKDLLPKELLPKEEERIMRLEEGELVEQLYAIQKDRKCLIVLDDIWSMNAWNNLRPAFRIKEAPGSKILLTTRKKNVAEVGFVYELKGLSETDAWELLQKKAFPGGDSSDTLDDKQMKLGMEMAKDCGGLPLAIIVLGRLLATKCGLIQWESVRRNMMSYLSKGKEGVALRVLALSYNELPYQLKLCFLYLGNFSEDSEIVVESLYQLWMAEDLLSSADRIGEETLMDIAEKYLEELTHRSLVQVQLAENYSWTMRKFSYCRLHDLTRELCFLKGKEENFLKLVDFGGENEHSLLDASSSTSTTTNVRRLAIHMGKKSTDNRLVSSSFKKQISRHLRSLLIFARSSDEGSMRHILGTLKSHIKESKLLRVLSIEGSGTRREAPKDIRNLIHLRYLRVQYYKFLLFSSSLENLEHLETLDLRWCRLLCGPKVLQKMGQLRHLYLPKIEIVSSKYDIEWMKGIVSSKLRLDELSKLETLEGFDTSSCDVGDLFMLNNLRKLQAHVYKLEDLEGIINYLNTTPNYFRHTSLTLGRFCGLSSDEGQTLLRQLFGCCNLHELDIRGPIRKLPESNHCFLPNLAVLELDSSKLEDDPMPMLEKLPNLRVLYLTGGSFLGMHCSAMGFPKLRRLDLSFLTNLENWTVDDGAMPNLSNLSLYYCRRLKMIPDGLRFMKKLQKLSIISMPDIRCMP